MPCFIKVFKELVMSRKDIQKDFTRAWTGTCEYTWAQSGFVTRRINFLLASAGGCSVPTSSHKANLLFPPSSSPPTWGRKGEIITTPGK